MFQVLNLPQLPPPKIQERPVGGETPCNFAISVLELQCSFQLHVELEVREEIKKKGQEKCKIG